MADIFEGVELTPEQQRELVTLRSGYATLEGLLVDGKTAAPLKRLLRQKYPDRPIAIPEDDIAAPLVAAVEEKIAATNTKLDESLKVLAEKQEAFEKQQAERIQKQQDTSDLADLEGKINATVKNRRLTDVGKELLVKTMMERGVHDPEVVADHMLQNMEKPAPVASNGLAPAEARRNGAPDVDLFQVATGHDDESMKLLHKNPDKWMMQEAQKVIDEGIAA